MLAKYEKRTFIGDELVWVGKYKNLHNISHWHLEHEIIASATGKARVMIDDRLCEISKGECVFCPGGTVHYIDADEGCILVVCLFDERLVKNLTSIYELQNPVFVDSYSVAKRLNRIHDELKSEQLFCSDMANTMLAGLIIDIFRYEKLIKPTNKVNAAMNRYKELLNWIDEGFRDISFSDAARYMSLTEAYFSRYFKRMSGMTFSQYLNFVKTEKAVEILTSDKDIPVTELMINCGFNTIRNFNRIFKELTGYSPTSLPADYSLNVRSIPTVKDTFDPTLETSILL